MIPKYKANNRDTWRQFKRICALLHYPLKYFNYFSQKDHYNGKSNIN